MARPRKPRASMPPEEFWPAQYSEAIRLRDKAILNSAWTAAGRFHAMGLEAYQNIPKKEEAADGVFFKKGGAFNQGNIFTFDKDEFIDGCEKAVERYKSSPINEEGLKLQQKFTYDKTIQSITDIIKTKGEASA